MALLSIIRLFDCLLAEEEQRKGCIGRHSGGIVDFPVREWLIGHMGTFSCPTQQVGNVLVLRPSGYLDESGGLQLRALFDEPLKKGVKKFLINLAGTPVINSQGITQILEICEAVIYENQGNLGLMGLSELYADVFTVVGIAKMVRFFPDEESALKGL